MFGTFVARISETMTAQAVTLSMNKRTCGPYVHLGVLTQFRYGLTKLLPLIYLKKRYPIIKPKGALEGRAWRSSVVNSMSSLTKRGHLCPIDTF